MPTRIKFTNLLKAQLTNSNLFIRELVASKFCRVCFSKFNHDFTLPFLDGQIRKNLFAEIKESIARRNPRKYLSLEFSRTCMTCTCGCRSLECLIKPINKVMISIINLQDTSVMFGINILSFFRDKSYIKTTFSVNYSCHIGKLRWYKDGWNIIGRSFVLRAPLLNFHNILSKLFRGYYIVMHDECLLIGVERLSERTQRWDAIV